MAQFADGLGILARLNPQSDLAKSLNDTVIDTLYNTVPHPPASLISPTHVFRQADGGGNNILNPDIGRAGTSYSRSVQGKTGLPRTSLPDPGLIFDSILKRKGVGYIFIFMCAVTDSFDTLAQETCWWNVQPHLLICIHCHPLAFPHRYKEHVHQQHKLLP